LIWYRKWEILKYFELNFFFFLRSKNKEKERKQSQFFPWLSFSLSDSALGRDGSFCHFSCRKLALNIQRAAYKSIELEAFHSGLLTFLSFLSSCFLMENRKLRLKSRSLLNVPKKCRVFHLPEIMYSSLYVLQSTRTILPGLGDFGKQESVIYIIYLIYVFGVLLFI
jgi:hypothetical protein